MKIKQQLTALVAAGVLAHALPAEATPTRYTPEVMLSLARVGAADLSPDGKTLVYSVGFPNLQANKIQSQLFRIAADGSSRKQLTSNIAGVHSPRWIQ